MLHPPPSTAGLEESGEGHQPGPVHPAAREQVTRVNTPTTTQVGREAQVEHSVAALCSQRH